MCPSPQWLPYTSMFSSERPVVLEYTCHDVTPSVRLKIAVAGTSSSGWRYSRPGRMVSVEVGVPPLHESVEERGVRLVAVVEHEPER